MTELLKQTAPGAPQIAPGELLSTEGAELHPKIKTRLKPILREKRKAKVVLAEMRPQSHGGALKSGHEIDEWPIFQSLAQCAARTGISKDRLSGWKSDGAPGFRGSRVYFGELLPWMIERLFAPANDAPIDDLPPVLTMQDALYKQKYLERASVLIEFSVAMGMLRDALLPLRQFLLAMGPSLGHRCNPIDPVFAQKAIEAHVKQGMRMIADAEREKISK